MSKTDLVRVSVYFYSFCSYLRFSVPEIPNAQKTSNVYCWRSLRSVTAFLEVQVHHLQVSNKRLIGRFDELHSAAICAVGVTAFLSKPIWVYSFFLVWMYSPTFTFVFRGSLGTMRVRDVQRP